jgi:hypothetical protein
MVAYWLKDEVNQDPDPDVIPDQHEYAEAAIEAIAGELDKLEEDES